MTEQVRTRTEDSTDEIQWEVFERVYARAAGPPAVNIHKSGILNFNRPAYEALGSPSHIIYLTDRARHLLAFRPSDDANAASYKVTTGKKQATTVSATVLLRHLGLGRLLQNIRCPLQRTPDGTYYIDLSSAIGEEDSNGDR